MRTKLTFILFLFIPPLIFSQEQPPSTPAEVVELIKKNITCPWSDQTVDTFKAGDPESELRGIAVCMFADMETLRQAVRAGCNFIITHEPLFYNHTDDISMYAEDPVFKEKMEYIKGNQLVIFRFHDHIHMTHPDGIKIGMLNKTGLENYAANNGQTHFRIPETTLRKYAGELKAKLNMETIRIIGNPEMVFSKVAFMAGAPGGPRHIRTLAGNDTEVLIAGEAPEWETYLYANDAVALGKNKAVIFLGHIKSEEAGMEYCARWLDGFIKGLPIRFIENKSNFSTF